MSAEPTLEQVLRDAMDSRLGEVRTALPGKIVSYDSAKQVCDVQPQLKDVAFTKEGVPVGRSFPVLKNVPVAFPRGGGFFLSFPLAAGDFVLLVFAERALDQWRSKGDEAYPGDVRQHSLTGAVAYPGLYPTASALGSASSTDLVVGKEGGGVVHITPSGEVRLGSAAPASFVALADKVDQFIATLDALFRSGWVPVPMDGGAALKAAYAASFAAPPGSVAASKVKAL